MSKSSTAVTFIFLLAPAGAWAATMNASPDTVTEQAGFDQEFTLTLEGDQFLSTVSAVYVDLGGDFSGLSVADVTYLSSDAATVTLTGDLVYDTGEGTITVPVTRWWVLMTPPQR